MNKVPRPPELGKNILALRKAKGLSLDELAQRSGVSKAMLSQVEQQRTNPTVATVWKIAHGLEVSLQDLLGDGVEQPRFEVVRRESATIIKEGGCEIQIVSPIHMAEDLELYYLRFSPRGRLDSTPHFHNTDEIATAIKGEFEIVSGDHRCTLKEGDGVLYAADTTHSIRNVKAKPAELFLVVHFKKA